MDDYSFREKVRKILIDEYKERFKRMPSEQFIVMRLDEVLRKFNIQESK